ncbi:MAG: helix-turn-helix domain-containing protein [Sphingorhabdus sp.]
MQHALAPLRQDRRIGSVRRSAPASAVVALLDALEAVGGDCDAALKAAGLQHLAGELREARIEQVPRSAFASFAQEAVLTFEEQSCLRDRRPRFPVSQLKMLCHLMSACPTLDVGIRMAIDFHAMAIGERWAMGLTVNNDRATFSMNIPYEERTVGDLLVLMYGLTTFHRLFGWFTGEELTLLSVQLCFPAALEEPALNELLQMKPVFDASEDSFSFPVSTLSRPIVRGYADIERLFMLFPFDLLPPDYGDGRIVDLIRFAMRAGFARREAVPGMARLAEMFGLTPSTLRRRIADEGTTLIALRKACRMEAALDLLQGSTLSVKEIAARVQFNDTATFRRAFRAWSGKSPSAFRNTGTEK